MRFDEAKTKLNELARRPGFSDVDVIMGTDKLGTSGVMIRFRFRGQPIEFQLGLSGNEQADELVFDKLVEAFGAPLSVWEVRLASIQASAGRPGLVN